MVLFFAAGPFGRGDSVLPREGPVKGVLTAKAAGSGDFCVGIPGGPKQLLGLLHPEAFDKVLEALARGLPDQLLE